MIKFGQKLKCGFSNAKNCQLVIRVVEFFPKDFSNMIFEIKQNPGYDSDGFFSILRFILEIEAAKLSQIEEKVINE